ncbi:glycoside hydrolase family 28 protein [Luedemannella helvata]|uniref:Exopolygalacturonase PelB n=1 Tax=Luedemannella helvata TaxID=349315 RepID=A0ABP4WDV8_9ACTN
MTATAIDGAAAVRAMVRPPTFPDREFRLAGGGGDHTDAFREAIDACHAAGGGRVVVPPGDYLTGPIRLRSGVDLHVSAGATVRFRREPAAYLPEVPTRWQGVELMGYSPFVYAYGERDIALTGGGTLDGRADDAHWWAWKPLEPADFALLERLVDEGVPPARRVFGDGYHLPPSFVQPYRCENVLISGVTLINSPFWQVHPVLCRNVTVTGVTARSHGHNNDGCNPESCDGVVIEDCHFDTGDDCVAIKAGRNADGRRLAVPCRNIVISDCTFADGHGGVTIGSEMSGGVEHVYASNLRMDSPNLWTCARFKTNSVRGGFIRDVHVTDVTVGRVRDQVLEIDFAYEEGDAGSFPPGVDGIHLRDWRVASTDAPWRLAGYPRGPIGTVTLTGIVIDAARSPAVARDVTDLRLTRVTVNGERLG